jgi:VWFA-related protein
MLRAAVFGITFSLALHFSIPANGQQAPSQAVPQAAPSLAQQASPQATGPVLSSNSTLVLIPALVTNKAGQPVFTLKADDFTATDDGVPQKLHLEDDSDSEPLALVIALQTGGAGAHEVDKYRNMAPLIDSLAGAVPHRIAVVAFGSTPKLVQDFVDITPENATSIDGVLHNLTPDDDGGSILDTLLRDQPPQYRRAILLISETLDRTSKLTLDQALRDVSDTNTIIYSLAFSSARFQAGRDAGKALSNDEPGLRHGCMANENAPATTEAQSGTQPEDKAPEDEDLTEDTPKPAKRTGRQLSNQAYNCLGVLLPPFALAKVAFMAGINGLRRNVPETVANLTGGEYYTFKDPHSIERNLITIANHVPNRYMLSFQPQAPHPGLHAVSLHLKNYPDLTIQSRSSYWAEPETAKP